MMTISLRKIDDLHLVVILHKDNTFYAYSHSKKLAFKFALADALREVNQEKEVLS